MIKMILFWSSQAFSKEWQDQDTKCIVHMHHTCPM